MRRKRRTHSPEFKAKVALAACQGELTMAELVKKFDVHANQVTDWKRQLLDGAAGSYAIPPFRSPRCRLREAMNARSGKGCKLFRAFAGKGLVQVEAPV